MASFCAKCGRKIPSDAVFCPYCSAAVRKSTRKAAPVRDAARRAEPSADFSERNARADVRNNRTMAMLAYPSVLILVPILLARRSYFARFHINQAVLPNLLGTALLILGILLTPVSSFFGWLFALLDLPLLILRAIGFRNARNGLTRELPFIGKFRFFQ